VSEAARRYEGSELELFADATVWKRYWSARLIPFLGSSVIEVGAGLGANTAYLNDGSARTWLCVEPDPQLAGRIRAGVETGRLPANVSVRCGTLAAVPPGAAADTIVYVDVLEHIEDDRAELRAAAERLAPGGHVIVLAPAHQRLYSKFDAAIGHFRRYSRRSLLAAAGPELALVRAFYLDAAGLLASAANALLLKSATPTPAQIALWDRVLVRCSRVVDALTMHRLGKTVVAVWRRR
jgi:SAM-dependent methyltransferase